MKKLLYIMAIYGFISGCSPVLFRNPKNDQLVECSLSGSTPIINRAECISDYTNKGWVKTTKEQEIAREEKAREDYKNKLAQGKEAISRCRDNAAKRPELEPLAGKLSLTGANDQSFAMLANQSKPTENEKGAIRLYGELLIACAKEQNKILSDASFPPAIIAVSNTGRSKLQSLLAALYNGSITYGEYASYRQQIVDSTETAMANVVQELERNAAEADARSQQIAAQNAIAQAQIEQAWASKMNATASMMNALKPIPTPPTVSYGNQKTDVSCTSMPGLSSGSVTTTCH